MHNIKSTIQRVTWLSVIINLCLTSIKFVAGIWGNSQAVIADATHGLSDLFTDAAILIGSSYWSKPPDHDHPYGHHRIETLITILIGFILLVTAIGLGYRATQSIISGTNSLQPEGPLFVTIIAIISKEILYRITQTTAKKIKSSALFANAKHHRSDVLSSLPVLTTLIISWIAPQLGYIDQIGAIIVSLFIAKAAWEVSAPSISELTEKSAPPEIIREIEYCSMNIEGVKSVHAIRTRKVGAYYHMDLHIQVNPKLSIYDGHIISGKVKNALLQSQYGINDVVVHIEPFLNL